MGRATAEDGLSGTAEGDLRGGTQQSSGDAKSSLGRGNLRLVIRCNASGVGDEAMTGNNGLPDGHSLLLDLPVEEEAVEVLGLAGHDVVGVAGEDVFAGSTAERGTERGIGG